MTDLPFPDWTASAADAQFTASDDIRSKRTMFERNIRRRNFFEYAAGALIIGTFGWVAWLTFAAGEFLVSASWASLIICTVIVLLNLRRVGSVLPANPEVSCNEHLRVQMVHQHNALSSVSRWYVGPFVPGMVFVVGAMTELTARTTGWALAVAGMAFPALLIATIFLGVIWLNKRAARGLETKIAELDDLASG